VGSILGSHSTSLGANVRPAASRSLKRHELGPKPEATTGPQEVLEGRRSLGPAGATQPARVGMEFGPPSSPSIPPIHQLGSRALNRIAKRAQLIGFVGRSEMGPTRARRRRPNLGIATFILAARLASWQASWLAGPPNWSSSFALRTSRNSLGPFRRAKSSRAS